MLYGSNKTTLSSCELLEIAKSEGVPVRVVHSHSSSNMGGKFTYIMHSINKSKSAQNCNTPTCVFGGRTQMVLWRLRVNDCEKRARFKKV